MSNAPQVPVPATPMSEAVERYLSETRKIEGMTLNNTITYTKGRQFTEAVEGVTKQILSEAELRHGVLNPQLATSIHGKVLTIAYLVRNHREEALVMSGSLKTDYLKATDEYLSVQKVIVDKIAEAKTFEAVDEELTVEFMNKLAVYVSTYNAWMTNFVTALAFKVRRALTTLYDAKNDILDDAVLLPQFNETIAELEAKLESLIGREEFETFLQVIQMRHVLSV